MSKENFEKYTNAQLTELIKSAMSERCIKPRLVYHDALDVLLARLADKPRRNCDIGSAEEQEIRFKKFCNSHYNINNVDGECNACPLNDNIKTECEFAWMQMPYEEGDGE